MHIKLIGREVILHMIMAAWRNKISQLLECLIQALTGCIKRSEDLIVFQVVLSLVVNIYSSWVVLSYSISIKSCPFSTGCPFSTSIDLMIPSPGALMTFSIFMASKMSNGSPF